MRKTPNQLLRSYSFDLYDPANAEEALRVACEPHGGRSPDAAFLCAGKSTPGFYVEQTVDSLKRGMDDGYWVQAWSAMVRVHYNLHAVHRSLVHKGGNKPHGEHAGERKDNLRFVHFGPYVDRGLRVVLPCEMGSSRCVYFYSQRH